MDLSTKIKYEISLWEEYPTEKKICILGSNEFQSKLNIFEPIFTKKVNGANTLTFSIYAKYFNDETKQLELNPLVQYLHNESKIKLKYYPYEDSAPEWYDFIIKKIEESSDKCKVSYTATDFYVNELAKSGFELQFDVKLENNLGTINELAEKVLEGTDWSIAKESESVEDETEEALYWIRGSGEDTVEKYFIFYSSTIEPTYKGYQILKVDGDIQHYNGIITNGIIEFRTTEPEFSSISIYRGKPQVFSRDAIYDKALDRYVQKYKEGENSTWEGSGKIVGYTESEYVTTKNIINFITNGYSITTDSGWTDCNGLNLENDCLPSWSSNKYFNTTRKYGIKLTGNTLMNSGFNDNLKKIAPISRNKKYAVRIKIADSNGDFKTGSSNTPVCFEIAPYTYNANDGKITKKASIRSVELEKESTHYYKTDINFDENYSLETLEEEKYGIFITNLPSDFYLVEAEFFEQVEIKDKWNNNCYILPNGQGMKSDGSDTEINVSDWAQVKTLYSYYVYDDSISKESDIRYIYQDYVDSNQYTPIWTNKKHRSITAKESNRFNLLQTIAEQFEMWCLIKIGHDDNGKIDSKEILFKKEIGRVKSAPVIKYGLNLKSIKRTLDSDKIATKLIVKNNSNEHADSGSCSITRAKVNPSGENFVLNLDYYVNKNMIQQETLNKHLYTDLVSFKNIKDNVSNFSKIGIWTTWQDGDLVGLYSGLKDLNNERDKLITEQSALVADYSTYESNYEVATQLLEKAEEAHMDLCEDLNERTGLTYDDFTKGSGSGYLDDEKVQAILTDISLRDGEIATYRSQKNEYSAQLTTIESSLDSLSIKLQAIEDATSYLINEFEKIYRPFIQEASWISEDYTDDQLYYLDAEGVLRGSAFPKVSYQVDALDLGYHPDFKYFHYDIADVIMVEDTENFGWAPATGDPFQEEFVITEIKICLETPEKNSITTKNYRTSFQDLFQRFAATTQQLQFSEGDWNKVSKVVEGKQITSESLKDAFANNANILSNVSNQSVVWDEKGITTTNTLIPSDITRITSSGIFLTKDGGLNWTTGITPDGINAKVITTGQLNADKVVITNGRDAAFKWDKDGLNAYQYIYEKDDDGKIKIDEDTGEAIKQGYSASKFVRMDSHGFYGVTDSEDNFQKNLDTTPYHERVDYVRQNAAFSLTYKGLVLGQKDSTNGYFNFDTSEGTLNIQAQSVNITSGNTNGINLLKQTSPIDLKGFEQGWVFDPKPSDLKFTYTEMGTRIESKNIFSIYQNLSKLSKNKTYTLSGKYCGKGPLQISISGCYVYNKNNEPITGSLPEQASGDLYSFTFYFLCYDDTNVNRITITPQISNAYGNYFIYVEGLKLELGKEATPWTDSGLDVQVGFSILSDRIQSQVEGVQEYVDEEVGSISTKVGTLELQTATEITSAAYGVEPIPVNGKLVYPYVSSGSPQTNPPKEPDSEFQTNDLCVDYKTGDVYKYYGKTTGWIITTMGPVNTTYGQLETTKEQINAKVSDSYTGEGFGWNLKSDGFGLYSFKSGETELKNTNRVFYANKNGVTIGNTQEGATNNYLKFENGKLVVRADKIQLGSTQDNLLAQTNPNESIRIFINGDKNITPSPTIAEENFNKNWECYGNDKEVFVVHNYDNEKTKKFGDGYSIKLNSRRGNLDQVVRLQRGTAYTFSSDFIGGWVSFGIYKYKRDDKGKLLREEGNIVLEQARIFDVLNSVDTVGRYVQTFTIPTNSDDANKEPGWEYWNIRLGSTETSKPVYWFHPKLEEGSQATPWKNSQKDYSSSLDILSDQMVARVGSGETGFSWKLEPTGFSLSTTGSSANEVFKCDASGLKIKGNAEFTGKVTATEGYIGGTSGWTIQSRSFYNGKSSYSSSDSGIYIGTDGIALGSGTRYVKISNTGNLSCNSGTIAGWIIGADKLSATTNGSIKLYSTYNDAALSIAGSGNKNNWRIIAGSNFGVDSSGNIYASGGKIGPLTVNKDTLSFGTFDETNNINDGLKITDKGYLRAKHIYTTQATIGPWNCIYGDRYAKGDTGFHSFYGTGASTKNIKIMVKGLAYAIGASSSNDRYIDATWQQVVDSAILAEGKSDYRVKKNIETYGDGYEILFDNLKPCRYKYIDGTSDRYHTGFVAQEVVSSIEKAGLNTQEFAGVVLMRPGEEDECWYLRRDEFVSLNTWQIQKLKSRVAELEQKIAALESKGE